VRVNVDRLYATAGDEQLAAFALRRADLKSTGEIAATNPHPCCCAGDVLEKVSTLLHGRAPQRLVRT
jgi:hypothetical protein